MEYSIISHVKGRDRMHVLIPVPLNANFCVRSSISLCTCLLHPSTVRMWMPTASTLLRMMVKWTLTFLHWTPMSQSISLVSAPWPWWRNTPHLALPPDSRCLSECKYAYNLQSDWRCEHCVNRDFSILFSLCFCTVCTRRAKSRFWRF